MNRMYVASARLIYWHIYISIVISLLKKIDLSLNLWHARSFDKFEIWHEA